MAASSSKYQPPDATGPDTALWRDPTPPPKRVLEQEEGRILDPSTAMTLPGVKPFSTVYVGPRLIISSLFDVGLLFARLNEVAAELGWTLTPDRGTDVPEPLARRRPATARARSRAGDAISVVGVNLTVAEGNGTAVQAPDGWVLLQQARARFGLEGMRGVDLDHVVFLRGGMWGPNPGMWGPNPGMWGPNTADLPMISYMFPGSGGREPVAYVGPRPHRRQDKEIAGRRPVVAVLDTGCGAHPWLDAVVQTDVKLNNQPIGYFDKQTNPEIYPDQVGPLDGGIDPYSGHGTFICGLIHQSCPDADIIAWRVVDSAGPIRESALIKALQDILTLVDQHAADPTQGRAIDILSLSLCSYHETPEDDLFEPP